MPLESSSNQSLSAHTRPLSRYLVRRFSRAASGLPPRTKAILALALLLLTWRCAGPSTGLIGVTTALRSDTLAVRTRLVKFPPTTFPERGARLCFANGAVQEVFPSSAVRDEYEPLWERSEVVAVELPFGGRLRWFGDNGEEGTLERGKGDDCRAGACRGIERVKYEQDAVLGLRQMRLSDPSDEITFSIPPSQPFFSPSAVTLTTQFTVSRLSRFERMLHAWNGPLSTSIYFTDPSDISALEDHLSSPHLSSAWEKVALTFVKPDYSISESALLKRLRYPINMLRNLAIRAAPTSYILVIDVDFVPSPRTHDLLSTRGVPLLHLPSTRNSPSPTLLRTALVIPTFALSPSFNASNTPFPSSLSALSSLFHASPPLATLTDPNAGHGPTLPSLLFSPPPSLLLAHSPLSSVSPAWTYSVCYEPQWEPYYLLHRSSHPFYDERFTDQGGDKQSHAALLNAMGYEFRVVRDAWVVHPPKRDRKEEEWPAARLVRQGGKPDGSHSDVEREKEEEEEEEGGGEEEHFNLEAQRDESRFRYFQDFMPEMERAFGRNWRWPRGCSAREAGGRAFGRARVEGVFGL
ncbi:hypothetical protein JCM8547_005462 [Rhodosporidiobolus lusitaniae]